MPLSLFTEAERSLLLIWVKRTTFDFEPFGHWFSQFTSFGTCWSRVGLEVPKYLATTTSSTSRIGPSCCNAWDKWSNSSWHLELLEARFHLAVWPGYPCCFLLSRNRSLFWWHLATWQNVWSGKNSKQNILDIFKKSMFGPCLPW